MFDTILTLFSIMTLNLLFSLPKVLQDTVHEYNVDHRVNFSPVLDQLNRRTYLMRNLRMFELCDDCYERIDYKELYVTIYFGGVRFKCCYKCHCATYLVSSIQTSASRNT